MRITASTFQMREMFTMIVQQLLSVFWLVASQQGAKGFFLAPNQIHRIPHDGKSVAFASNKKSSGDEPVLSSLGSEDGDDSVEEAMVRENDISMFLNPEEKSGGFDSLEFFMTADASIQKLEEVEDFFREEPMGIMMEEQSGVVPSIQQGFHKENIATTNPVANDKIKMVEKPDTISIDEEPMPKNVMYYDYDGSLTKIKSNLCDSPVIYYTE
jgi:hypothetical protein